MPAPRRRLSRVTGLRHPEPKLQEPDPAPTPESEPEPSPSRLRRVGSWVIRGVTWDGWLKLGAIATALGVLVGFYFTNNSFHATAQQNEVARETQITDRFTKAVEMLDNTGNNVRIGGIYSLEQLANDSPEMRTPILEVLSAYIRSKAGITEGKPCDATQGDVQVAFTVIGRRSYEIAERIDLTHTCLARANLAGANLSGMKFGGAKMPEADLRNALFHTSNQSPLESDVFNHTDLSYANIFDSHLQGIDFAAANLTGVSFGGATLRNVRFIGSNLTSAYFDRADLSGVEFYASNLTRTEFEDDKVPGLSARNIQEAKFTCNTITDAVWPRGFQPKQDAPRQHC